MSGEHPPEMHQSKVHVLENSVLLCVVLFGIFILLQLVGWSLPLTPYSPEWSDNGSQSFVFILPPHRDAQPSV